MAKFKMDSFTDTFNESSKKVIQNSPFVKVDLSDIRRNKQNFYSISDIETLKHSIKTTGLQSPLVVLPKNADGHYVLLSGERRFTALNELVEEGNEDFKSVYCSIVDPNELDIALTYDEKVRYLIVTTNSEQRDLTTEDVLQQIRVLRETYVSLKANGEDVPSKARAFVAKSLNMSETQVQRYSTIEKNLMYEFFELFCKDILPISVACEIAKLDKSTQEGLYEKYKEESFITQPMVDEYLASLKKPSQTKRKTDDEKRFGEVKKALATAEKWAVVRKGVTEENRENVMSILKTIEENIAELAKICGKK